MTTTELAYTLAPAWTVARGDGTLLLSAGADARYELDLDEGAQAFDALVGATPGGGPAIRRSDLSAAAQKTLEQLVTAEVLRPQIPVGPQLRVATIGDAPAPVFARREELTAATSTADADVVVIYRASSTLRGLLDRIDYRAITHPHLFVDAAFHHTISIGPLTFPGETSCLECLYGRLASRWDDAQPPPAPRATDVAGGLVAELTSLELLRIAAGDTALANKTVAWDVDARTTTTDRLLKVQKCPVCTRHRPEADGSIPLPWVTA